MSLSAHDARARGRSKSPGRREHSRSRSRVSSTSHYAAESDPQRHEYAPQVSYQYAAPRPRRDSSRSPPMAYPQSGAPPYDVHRAQSAMGAQSVYAQPQNYTYGNAADAFHPTAMPQDPRSPSPHYVNIAPRDQSGYAVPGAYNYSSPPPPPPPPPAPAAGPPAPRPGHERAASLNASGNFSVNFGHSHSRPASPQQPQYAQPISPQPAYAQPVAPYYAPQTGPGGYAAQPVSTAGGGMPGQFPYSQPPQGISYVTAAPAASSPYAPPPGPPSSGQHVVEIRPSGAPPPPPLAPPTSQQSLTPYMHRLSVSGGAPPPHLLSGQAPPGSPLLEAYHGTYQTMSPMPSPMMLPSGLDGGIDDLSLEPYHSSSSSSGSGHRRRRTHSRHRSSSSQVQALVKAKTVGFHSIESDALELIKVLNTRTFEKTEPLIAILPRLTDDEIMNLRVKYKENCIAPGGKGVNIAKHIKVKVGGPFGKACYATALGRWESEAYWANFWYQSNTSRRELLIESLMGRTNDEIRNIKAVFSDKRYSNSLEKCMKAELPSNKFRVAMLLVLEEKRQEESRYVSDPDVRRDAADLYRSLTAKEGGETAMIKIVVTRSDTHLRQVLKAYEATYRGNFAKDMLKKSTNLVGEILAHILNGVINRPMRDAMLLHHALQNYDPTAAAASAATANANKIPERTELLVSRLVRVHWDRPHLDLVKADYRRKYGVTLEQDVVEHTHGEFGKFCLALVRRY